MARRHGLTGFVCNDGEGVTVEAQGAAAQLELFQRALADELPPLAVVEHVDCAPVAVACGEREFTIRSSVEEGARRAAVTVDTAVCDDCAEELLSPADRRAGYALINCTNCGPRYSIIRRIPYDRPNTTMAGFTMCAACRAEYTDPADRRFHAQPIACRDCGPQVQLVSPRGTPRAGDPVAGAAALLRAGGVLAIKGLGGFHLAVRADRAGTVERLRRRKHRDAKPLALMCADVAEVERLVALGSEGRRMLVSPARPIVLAERRPGAAVAEAVAPGQQRLGVMLPYTPLQLILFAQPDCPRVLVMTSGNDSEEPLVIDNQEALQRLGPLCDAILWHDRPIERCVDDSVVLDRGSHAPLMIRRARGFVPHPVPLPVAAPAALAEGLCVGGELKNTVAVVRGGEAIVSQHLGQLTHPLAYRAFQRAAADLASLWDVRPRWIAADLHPLYGSTRYARELAARAQVPLIGVQHHHAHAAALLAEHNLAAPVLAVVCDGVGYGSDGAIWGGELLMADLVGFRRLARLRPLWLPGGDAAARDTRRCGLALLHQLVGDDVERHAVGRELVPDTHERRMLAAMLRRGTACVESSAAGRVFDGVAALLGVCRFNDHEGQAGMWLEARAAWASAAAGRTLIGGNGDDDATGFRLGPDPRERQLRWLDLAPLTAGLLQLRAGGAAVADIAWWFHDRLAAAWDAAVACAARETGLTCVALTGGVFANQLLSDLLRARLVRRGLRVLVHADFPPGDGGLALGQAAVAAARLSAERQRGGAGDVVVRGDSRGAGPSFRPMR